VSSQEVEIAGLNAVNAESIEAVFVFGITTTTGLVIGLLIGFVVVEVVDLLHAIKSETINKKLHELNPHLELKI
jgi:predicted DNA repair protein MutK